LYNKLNELITEEKIYLDLTVSLDKASRLMITNRTQLSHLINEHYQDYFNGFINKHLINEARRLLSVSKYDHLSVEGIGNMAEFSPKVTFHVRFKEQIGLTPSYFREIAIGE